jgi:hypothetical protein
MIEKLINDMLYDNVYCSTFKICPKTDLSTFTSDCGPYIESKQIRLKHFENRIEVYLGPESLKKII